MQVAHDEYDAPGRFITSSMRFDADVDAVTKTRKYYHDGRQDAWRTRAPASRDESRPRASGSAPAFLADKSAGME